LTRSAQPAKPPLRWTGVLFAFAATLLLVTLGDIVAQALPFGINAELLATVISPILAGIATALYTGSRGGMHAFVGALIAFPILGLVIFRGVWPLAVFATAFCIMAAAATEIIQRRREPPLPAKPPQPKPPQPKPPPPKRKKRA
jgi:membrane-bound metal-dependent hydrolase YbcI (DUF457 family)